MTASPAVGTPGDSPTAVFRRTLHLPTLTPPLRLTLLGADPSSRDTINPSGSSSSSSSTSASRVWSSTHPLPRHLPFLANLHLHTILALTPKHPFSEVPALESWSQQHNVRVRHIFVSKWKDDGASSLTRSVIEDTLPILLDRSASPLLVISTAPQLLAALLGLLRLIQGYDLEKGVLPEMARALRNGLEGEAEEEDRVGCEKWVRGWVGKEVLVRLQKERVNDWIWPQGTPLSLLRGAGLGRGKGHSSSMDEGERIRGGVNGVPAAQGQAHLHAPYRSSTVASLPTMPAPGSSSSPSVVHPYLKIKFQPEQAKEDAAAKAPAVPAAREPSADASQASHNEGEASGSTAAAVTSKEGSAAEKAAEDASSAGPFTGGSSTSTLTLASASSSSAVAVPPQEAPAHVQPNLPPLHTSTASNSSALPSGPSSAPTPTIPLPPPSFSPDPNPSAPAAPPSAPARRTHGRKRSLTISEGRSYSKGPEAEALMGRMTDAAAAAAITCSGIDIDGGGAARRLQLGQQDDDEQDGVGRPASLPVGSTSVVGMGFAPLDAGSGGGGAGRGRGRNAGGGADRRPDLAFLDVTPPTSLNVAVHGDGEGADADAMPRTPTQLNRSPSGSRSSSGEQWASQRRPSGDALAVGADQLGRFSAQDMTPTASRTSMSAAASASAAATAGPAPVSAASALWRRRRRSSAATTTTVKGNAPAALTGAEELSDGEAGDTTPKGVSSPAPTPSSSSSSSSSSFPTTPRPPLSRGAGHQASNSAAGSDARAHEPAEGNEEEDEDEDEHHLTPKAQARSQPIFGASNSGGASISRAGGGEGKRAEAGAMDPLAAGGAAVSTMLSGGAPPEGASHPRAGGEAAEKSAPSSSTAPTSDSGAPVSEADEEGDATVRQDEFLSRGGADHSPASSSTSAPSTSGHVVADTAQRPVALHAPQPGRPAMMHSQTGPPSSPVAADDDDEEEEEEEEEEDDEDEDDASHPISAGLEALDLA